MNGTDREPRRRRGGRKRKNSQFIDVAMDGYIRDQTLEKWRMVEDAIAVNGVSLQEALQGEGGFFEKGPYRDIWVRWWGQEVPVSGEAEGEHPIGRIEAAIRGATREEREFRKSRGDPHLEDTLHYKAFVDRAMDHLLEEASGEIEDEDENEDEV